MTVKGSCQESVNEAFHETTTGAVFQPPSESSPGEHIYFKRLEWFFCPLYPALMQMCCFDESDLKSLLRYLNLPLITASDYFLHPHAD